MRSVLVLFTTIPSSEFCKKLKSGFLYCLKHFESATATLKSSNSVYCTVYLVSV